MSQLILEFMRFTAPDPLELGRGIAEVREKLAAAVLADKAIAVVDAASDLGSMLTTARMEAEAKGVLEEHRHFAEGVALHEPAGWFWNAYATSLQYCGERTHAEEFFAKAIELSRAGVSEFLCSRRVVEFVFA